MGRLFWKLFIFIWLGQMAAVVGTGTLFWAERQGLVRHLDAGRGQPPGPPHDGGPRRFSELPRGAGPGGHPPRHDEFDDVPPRGPRPPEMGALMQPRGADIHVPIWAIVTGFLASLLCAAGLAWYFAKPIRRLREGFSRVANGELGARVGAGMGSRRDELADLGKDFDHMAERMQALVDGQKRLLHDVSHEMRSPLARLQAAVGLARQRPERSEETLSRIERESDRMNRLIGELLTLSRLEAGSIGTVAPVDMAELLQALVEDASFEATGRQVSIDYKPGGMAQVMANGELLHRAIENIVRNALRYSPAGGTVSINAGASDDRVFRICVQDQGPGVDENELEAIFTPFRRGNGENNSDGYGLGLAIARQIVRSAQGSIVARNLDSAGLEVCIELPVCRG